MMENFKQNYFNQNERMNPKLENMLKSNQLDLAKNPAFPKKDASGNPINFLELISYKRFLDVVEKAKRYTNLTNLSSGSLGQISSILMQGVKSIENIEAPHKLVLENLAVDLVVKEMEIPTDLFQFQCKIVPIGSINQDNFQKEVQEPKTEDISQAFSSESEMQDMSADDIFENEKHKRRFINMLIQGSSKKGHYMFELVRNRINQYNPNLAETYGIVMSINDLIYWILDDESIKQMASNPSSMAGKEEIEKSEEGGAIIKTEAICFPVSLHEIIKGVMEVFGTQGLPDDEQQAEIIINSVDSLSNETMDLRLGAVIWEKFYSAYPSFILEEGNRYLQHYLFARFCALSTDEFFRVSRLIMTDDPKGAKYFMQMVEEIQSSLKRDNDTNIDDINIDDIFNYKKGGRVQTIKESDIEIGQKFVLINGEIIEINRLFIENIDENFVEYSRNGKIYENSVNSLKNFINNFRGLISENTQFSNGGKIKSENNYDVYDNKRMLLNQTNEVEHHSEELNEQVKNTKQVPAWIIAKMERATTDLSDVTHYLDGENKMADGGQLGESEYEIVPHLNKFIVAKITYKKQDNHTYPSKEFIYGFNDKFLEFNNINSAQIFIDNITLKYPYGVPLVYAGGLLLASQLLQQRQQQQPQQQQQQQPQVVYYIPQPQTQPQNTGIIQNIPEMASGGELGYDEELVNDFCITNLIELANELQSVRYYVTNKFRKNDFEFKHYKGRLTIVFKEPASLNSINTITKFIEKAEDCHHIFEQSVNVSGSQPNGLSINLLSNKFSDREFKKGGKVYNYAPKKINFTKTKKITTELGDYNLGLITENFVYFVNSSEGDENANTIMYNKKGELLSDNYFASNDLYEKLINKSKFEFIHPDIDAYRQEILLRK